MKIKNKKIQKFPEALQTYKINNKNNKEPGIH